METRFASPRPRLKGYANLLSFPQGQQYTKEIRWENRQDWRHVGSVPGTDTREVHFEEESPQCGAMNGTPRPQTAKPWLLETDKDSLTWDNDITATRQLSTRHGDGGGTNAREGQGLRSPYG